MDEDKFLGAMVANPNDPTPRLLMADWLEDRDDPRAELMRIQEQLRNIAVPNRKNVEARMQQLLRDGVKPVLPRMTNSLGMRFVFIFPGEFLMGEETPHRERIEDEFWLSETVVTRAQWQSMMQTKPWEGGNSPSREPADHPATHVSCEDAADFCRQLSERDSQAGLHYTLPLQAQWEYACRAGTTSGYSFGDDENELEQYAWFEDDENELGQLAWFDDDDDAWEAGEIYVNRVGEKLPNPWGLFDMHGNVWEWCQDQGWYRGGSWIDPVSYCRSATRLKEFGVPLYRLPQLGFRVAATPSSEPSKEPESGAV